MIFGGEFVCRHGRPIHPQPHEPRPRGYRAGGRKHGRRKPPEAGVLMRSAHRSRSSFPRAARGCAAQNRSVRQASSRIQTVSSLHRRAHWRIPVSTSRSSGRVDRRSTAASSRPTLASRGTYTVRLRSSRTSGHHVRTDSRNRAADCEKDQVARMSDETLCHRAQAPSTQTVMRVATPQGESSQISPIFGKNATTRLSSNITAWYNRSGHRSDSGPSKPMVAGSNPARRAISLKN